MAKEKNQQNEEIEIGHARDVEYSAELADSDDIEANERAAAANRRAESKK